MKPCSVSRTVNGFETLARRERQVSANIDQIVAAMQRMTTGELRTKYAEVFGEQPRSRHKKHLINRIAWRVQANAEGDLSERARKRALDLANDDDLRLTAPRTVVATDERLPMADAMITREYKGRKIVVKVLESGFEYDGEVYASLSAVAKAVTGSHWSGNRFFGYQQKGGA